MMLPCRDAAGRYRVRSHHTLVSSGRVLSRLLLVSVSGVILLWHSTLQAQQVPPIPPDLDRNFIRGDQQRLLEEQQQRLEELQNLPGEQAEPPSPEAAEPSPCIDIAQVKLTGTTLLSVRDESSLVTPWTGRCLNINDLNELLGDITEHYVARGYVTTRAYLPQQDLNDGGVDVVVLEGRIEALESTTEVPTSRELFMASPAAEGDVLNLRDLEQLTDQLNRLPSRRSTMELVPGESPGASRVQINSEGGRPLRLSLGRNNDGSESTGEQQWKLGVEWDSPLGLADQFIAQLGHDVTRQSGRGSGDSYLSYRVPYGYWAFSWAWTESDYHTVAEADGFDFDLDGASERHRLQVERMLHRDDVSTTSASLGLSRLSTRNYIDGSRIDVSSQRLTELSIGLNHGRRIGTALVNADVGWQKGLTIFGADTESDNLPGSPEPQFSKATLTLSYQQPFTLANQSLTFSSLAHGQWSDDVLYSPQRLSLGGQSSVRGFKEQTLSGDSGGYWRNEIHWRHALDVARPVFHSLDTWLAYDVGVIHHGDHNPELHGRMSGAAIGLGLTGDHLAASVSFGRSIDRPDAIEETETPVYFNVEVFL
ncbi:ShlB/FhaC/HecB family hemolysin secretion/activation protein [Halomonas cupida]|uniref:ShlB/FhaC/HecB family hemolysin secretion/activation protein n=1 Tax=Halomonas cupida TaxID=44933 RepID=UPI0039B58493